jgi:plastocyanin
VEWGPAHNRIGEGEVVSAEVAFSVVTTPEKSPMRSVFLLAAMSCIATAAAPSHGVTVVVNTFNFDFSANPQGQPILDPTINLGDTIRWFVTQGQHATQSLTTATDEVWISGTLNQGDSFSHTFTHPGVYQYYCRFHAVDNGDGTYLGMGGSITVVPAPASVGLIGAAGSGLLLRRRRR